jgi:hypothetical protein
MSSNKVVACSPLPLKYTRTQIPVESNNVLPSLWKKENAVKESKAVSKKLGFSQAWNPLTTSLQQWVTFGSVSLRMLVVASILVLIVGIASPAGAQSVTSGDIVGYVTDPSGAVLPNASVTLRSQETGSTHVQATNSQGAYRFSLLPPGRYTVSVTVAGFQEANVAAVVAVGQATDVDITLTVGETTSTINVTSDESLLQTEDANISTRFSETQIALVPNPGNDLSYIAQTAPGVVQNTQAGSGNFSAYGLPATSNLFTVNGQNENDPFLNLNNSGATNLLLGNNDVREATVVTNGYSGQYGTLAGANVNYVTKSGSDKFHGNALYWWNGSALNAKVSLTSRMAHRGHSSMRISGQHRSVDRSRKTKCSSS